MSGAKAHRVVCDTPGCGKVRFKVCSNCDHCNECCPCGTNKQIVDPYVHQFPILVEAYVQEMGERQTAFGFALYIKVRRHDEKEMSWTDVLYVFNDRYPGQWAVQCFPPMDEVLDEANVYHLFVLEQPPLGMNIRRH